MTATATKPLSPHTVSDSRKRTRVALESILTKVGGTEFAERHLEDFVEYVFTGELSVTLRKLKDAGDETYHKVIRIVSEAQAEAIAEVVSDPQTRLGWFRSFFSRSSTKGCDESKPMEKHEELAGAAR